MSELPSVAVSGITGFVGSHCTARLLRAGYTVHGTVRKNKPEKVAHLTSLDVPGTLKIFEADLLTPDAFDEALEGCKYAMHVASPYSMSVKDPQKDLIDPAVNGTLSFLRSCKKKGVEKVVLTSSIGAIATGGKHGEVLDESVWNEDCDLNYFPYFYSKKLAEKAAWKFVEEEAPEIKLVAINAVGVLGPAMTKALNDSFQIVAPFAKEELPGILDMKMNVVDVRDVAEAHFLAMESDVAQGRYLCAADHAMSSKEIAEVCKEVGFNPSMRDLTGKLSSWFIKTISHVFPGGSQGQLVRANVGNPIILTNEKIKKDLKIVFRDAAETVKDTYENLIENGHLKDPRA